MKIKKISRKHLAKYKLILIKNSLKMLCTSTLHKNSFFSSFCLVKFMNFVSETFVREKNTKHSSMSIFNIYHFYKNVKQIIIEFISYSDN